ncbi:MAG: hypothetical protein IPP28_07220 [Xanthomonadales bacterium]|nr:hypothetical protein [Xanthomonadales bacterium]
MARFLDLLRRFYRWFRVPIWLGLGLAIGFLGPYLWYLDRLVRAGFDGLRFDTPSRVYARALELRPGRAMDAETLLLEPTPRVMARPPMRCSPAVMRVTAIAS